jgi:hypothetical protein
MEKVNRGFREWARMIEGLQLPTDGAYPRIPRDPRFKNRAAMDSHPSPRGNADIRGKSEAPRR